MSLCCHHLPGAAEERTHHLVDLAYNGLVAAAAEEAEVVGIASAHLHTWHWHTQGEEVLKEDMHRLSGGYKTSLSAEEPVVVVAHRIRNLASIVEEVQRMVMASACCWAMAPLEIGCLVVQASMMGNLHWTVASPVAAEASFAGTAGNSEFGLSLGEMEQVVGA